MNSLIITAPHSLCFIKSPIRDCDTIAFRASNQLVNQLNGFLVKYYPSTHLRSEIDLNRPEARNTDYREILSNNMSDCALLIDIHSFSRAGFGPDVDVVILDDVPGTIYGKRLYEIMRFHGISVAYMNGAPEINDIVEEARSRGIPAILIEYMESISRETIDQINNAIIEWIHTIF